jgi:arginine exporter protein ArgO
MHKLKRFTLIYFVVGIGLSSLFSFWDYNDTSSGIKFHQLTGTERNAMRVTGIILTTMNPVTMITDPIFVGGKPRNHKKATVTIVYILSLIPSYFIWFFLLTGKKGVGPLFGKTRK